MFERFTERARQVVTLAQQEARDFQHNYIGTEHIFLALLAEEQGLAAKILVENGLTHGGVRTYVRQLVGTGTEPITTGQIPFTPRAKKLFEMALREALSLGHNYIGTEHILLAVARHDEGNAYKILRKYELKPEHIRDSVIKHLSGPGKQQAKSEQDEVRELREKLDQLRKQHEQLQQESRERERAKLWTPAKTGGETSRIDGQKGLGVFFPKGQGTIICGDLTLEVEADTSGRVSILIKNPSDWPIQIS